MTINLLERTMARFDGRKRHDNQDIIDSAHHFRKKQFELFGFTCYIKNKNLFCKFSQMNALALRFAHGWAGTAVNSVQAQCCSLMRRSAAP
jgi:hypothetical protein